MISLLGLAVVALAVWAILRRVDVRLTLFVAALALGTLAGRPDAVVTKFLATLTDDRFVIPICSAMGFAHVLRLTGCDRHLVQLLVTPLRRCHAVLVPGGVLVGFLVNIPVVSQTSTAVVLGSVLLPLLRAAGVSAATAGATLLLGCSIGGELLNPGAPEFRTVADATGASAADCVRRVLPLVLPHLVLAAGVFWLMHLRAETHAVSSPVATAGLERQPDVEGHRIEPIDEGPPFRVNLVKALVPMVPIVLLFLTGKPFGPIHVPERWLTDTPGDIVRFDSRLVGAAMLVGTCLAALAGGRRAPEAGRAFFEGAGSAFANIISVIVTASCFGKGVELTGLAADLGDVITRWPGLLLPTAGGLPWAFAWVSGSGMASTQSLYGSFVAPARDLGVDPVHVGAVVSIASAAGRTMSPVAAVTLMCAALTETSPFTLIRRVAVPLTVGLVVVVALAAVLV